MKWPKRRPKAILDLVSGSEVSRRLYLPRWVLHRTHEILLPYWREGVETACFWFGVDAGQLQVVTTVALPKLYQTSGNYLVEMSSLRRMAALMRPSGLTNLAQVHTHPTEWVKHSPYDDEHAYSTRHGALSLVWPHYGATLGHDLHGIGVHERRNGEWIRLSETQTEERIRLVDDLADFRWEIERGRLSDDE
jgi:hypothetical protein